MAAKVDPMLVEILDRYEVAAKDALWDCHGTLVMYHKYVERIAAKAGIKFDPPIVIEAKSAEKTVAICVVGHMDGRSEWSIGEAAPHNNKNTYPFAMAEKRAKDRVALKLVGLAGFIYSEDEADDFKAGERTPVDAPPAPKRPDPQPISAPQAAAKTAQGWAYVTIDGKVERIATGGEWFKRIEADARKNDRRGPDLWAVNAAVGKEIVESQPDQKTREAAQRKYDETARLIEDIAIPLIP